jgi:hypothetical protein
MHAAQDEHAVTSPESPRSANAARLIETIVSADERLDATAFVTVLTSSGSFRFGGAPAVSQPRSWQERRSAIFAWSSR